MDFYDFKASYEHIGGDSDRPQGTEDLHAILFKTDKDGLSGTFGDLRVFEDRDYVGTVKPGQVWICRLKLNPKTQRNYFAAPVREVDASLLLEATADEIASLGDRIWSANPVFMEKALEQRIDALARERAEIEIDARQKACDAKIGELEVREAELSSSLSEKDARIGELEKTVGDLEDANRRKDARIGELETTIEGMQHPAAEATEGEADAFVITDDVSDETEQRIDGVLRMYPEIIYSRNLVHDKYTVHVDANWTTMILRPDPQGTLECRDNMVLIDMLAWKVPFKDMSIIDADFEDCGKITLHFVRDRFVQTFQKHIASSEE